jgi:hypothetical protein
MDPLLPGVPTFDIDIACYCFHCNCTILAKELSTAFRYSIVGHDVGAQNVVISKGTIRILRYHGSEWSVILPVISGWGRWHTEERTLPSTISRSLAVDALSLIISDTASGAEYRHYRGGEMVESLRVEEGEVNFESQLRTLPEESLGYDTIDEKLRELGNIPPLFSTLHDEVGQVIQPLEKVDIHWKQIAEACILDKM